MLRNATLRLMLCIFAFKILGNGNLYAQSAPHAPSPNVSFVTVQTGVKLEVLDWGGSGRPLILLSGLGDTAHVFDTFAPKLTARCHVFGITRRGFGDSSSPSPTTENYLADRLGDDVLAVVAALKLDKPVLAGHSIAGEELSSIGSRHPKDVSGLIYLDAGYTYAFYDRSRGDFTLDLLALRRKLDTLVPGQESKSSKQVIDDLLHTDLPQFDKDLRVESQNVDSLPPVPTELPAVVKAIIGGAQKFTNINDPVLAIFGIPRLVVGDVFRQRILDSASTFAKGVPSAHVVYVTDAEHYVFRSNEADVLLNINKFLDTLR